MDVTGRIFVVELAIGELYLTQNLPVIASVGFEATFIGEAHGATVEMMRSGETPEEAISTLKSAMTKVGINWTLEE